MPDDNPQVTGFSEGIALRRRVGGPDGDIEEIGFGRRWRVDVPMGRVTGGRVVGIPVAKPL